MIISHIIIDEYRILLSERIHEWHRVFISTIETIRTQIQANDHLKSKTTLEVVKILVEEDGFGSLYKGIRPVLISLLASNFIYFYTNNMFKVIYKKQTGKGKWRDVII